MICKTRVGDNINYDILVLIVSKMGRGINEFEIAASKQDCPPIHIIGKVEIYKVAYLLLGSVV